MIARTASAHLVAAIGSRHRRDKGSLERLPSIYSTDPRDFVSTSPTLQAFPRYCRVIPFFLHPLPCPVDGLPLYEVLCPSNKLCALE